MKAVISLLFLLLLINPAASQAKLVRVVTLADYEPFCFYQPNTDQATNTKNLPPGQASTLFDGLAWQVVVAAFHARGYTVELTVVPWKRGVALLDRGEVDLIFPAVKTEERLVRYLYSRGRVYPANHYLIYVNEQSDIQWQGLHSLNDKLIGAMRGFSYGSTWEEYLNESKSHPVLFNKLKRGFGLLKMNRIDALVGYEISHDYQLKLWGWDKEFKKLPPFATSSSYLMGLKSVQATRQLLNEFDAGKRQLSTSGELESILTKWGLDVPLSSL